MLKRRATSIILAALGFGILVLLEPAIAHSSFDLAGLEVVADSLDDGPHIYWRNDSSAVVFHFCDGMLETRDFTVAGTLRFRGLCGDSLTEYAVLARTPEIEPHVFDDVPKIFAVSDIHGEYEAFIDLLLNAGIVDEQLHWRWGPGHLVVDGDVFDRGDLVTECLWLIYRLEREARAAGGRVHFVLGNHELMVMQRDLEEVNQKYLNGIASPSWERDLKYWVWIQYQDLFGPDTEFGRWFRTKHAAVKLNGVIFVHGGIGPHVVGARMSLEEINTRARDWIDLRSYEIAFGEMPNFLYGAVGPFWYRGYHFPVEGWYPQATLDEVKAILAYYGARAIVVGHTQVDQVQGLYDGRVYAVDVRLEELGTLQGLLWEDGVFHRITGSGEREAT